MASKYLGTKKNIVTVEKLFELTNFRDGSNDIVESGDITWLKFEYNSKKLLIANKVILSTTWNKLNNSNLVLGKNINIDGVIYKCRLMTGANADPAPNGGAGGEWNELIIKYQSSLENFTMQEVTLCKESHTENPSTYCVARGMSVDISSFASMFKDNFRGWRPVLEYVGIEVPPSLNEDSTLINSVNKVNEIETTLKAQHSVLSDNLMSMGVNVLSSDKMSSLIDKVGEIRLGKKWASASGVKPTYVYMRDGSNSVKVGSIKVSGLDFRPRKIMLWRDNNENDSYYQYTLFDTKMTRVAVGNWTFTPSENSNFYEYCYVSNNGFGALVDEYGTYSWEAYK